MLTSKNWKKYLQKRSNYICTPCFQKYCKYYHDQDGYYNHKQAARYQERKSAVIFSYGNSCAVCTEDDYEKLRIRANINQLYNSVVDKNNYTVLCYNCYGLQFIKYKDKYLLRDKQLVVNHYGNQCLECTEDRIEILNVDYKNNNGAELRRQLSVTTGADLYRWLISNNYPDNLGIQILCYNCQRAKMYALKIAEEIKT